MMVPRLTFEQRKRLRRKRIAVIVGNIVIVTTFIFRDVLRDDLKEKFDFLNMAQLNYLSRSDVSEALFQMLDFTAGVNRYMHRLEKNQTKKDATEEDLLEYQFQLISSRINTERLGLQNIETLLRGMRTESPEYQDLKNKSDAVVYSYGQLRKDQVKTPAQKMQALLEIRQVDDPLFGNVFALGLRVWESSKHVGEVLDRDYRYVNYGFYVFFVLGVIVNLWGALSGVEMEHEIE